MQQIRFGRASLLAALVTVLGACHDMDRVSPMEPEASAFAKGGSKPATGGGGGGGGGSSAQKIAFSTDGSSGQIYTVNPDGSGLTVVPYTLGARDPAWSPDRKQLAFTIPSGAQAGLYVIDAAGTNRTRIYTGAAFAPSWSPDGSRIAFQATVANKPQILVVRKDGTNLVNATAVGFNYAPSWSPDGTRLVYYGSRPEGTGIWIVAEQGGARTLIVSCSDCRSPKWSPVRNDNRILFSTRTSVSVINDESAINIVNADGTNRKTFLKSTQHRDPDLRPSWSPDAKQIVFASYLLGARNLVIVNADGTNPKAIELDLMEYAPAWAR